MSDTTKKAGAVAPATTNETAVTLVNTAISPVSEIAQKNLPVIIDNRTKVVAFLSVLKEIKDEKADKWANDALVKSRARLKDTTALRMEITKRTDALKSELMTHEKAMDDAIDRVVKMRNEYAAGEAKKNKEAADKIETERVFKIHESEVKGRMKSSVETGIFKKVSDIEDAIAKMFSEMTLDNYKSIADKLVFTPKIKQEFYESLFLVAYDKKIMTEAQFADLVKRAQAWEPLTYNYLNGVFVKTINDICTKWRDQLMPRVRELEKIKAAAGSDQAAKMEKASKERAAREEAARKKGEEDKKKEIQLRADEQARKDALDAEFEAQAQGQKIIEQEGLRKKNVYRFTADGEKDLLKISKVIGTVIIHMLTENGLQSIYKKDKDGNKKQDEDGNAVYVDGIAYWLDALSTLKYKPPIEYLDCTEKITTVAKK